MYICHGSDLSEVAYFPHPQLTVVLILSSGSATGTNGNPKIQLGKDAKRSVLRYQHLYFILINLKKKQLQG